MLLNSCDMYWGTLSVLKVRPFGTVRFNAIKTAFSTDRMVSLPLLGEAVLYAYQIGHSGLSGNVSNIGLPYLIRTTWPEEDSWSLFYPCASMQEGSDYYPTAPSLQPSC